MSNPIVWNTLINSSDYTTANTIGSSASQFGGGASFNRKANVIYWAGYTTSTIVVQSNLSMVYGSSIASPENYTVYLYSENYNLLILVSPTNIYYVTPDATTGSLNGKSFTTTNKVLTVNGVSVPSSYFGLASNSNNVFLQVNGTVYVITWAQLYNYIMSGAAITGCPTFSVAMPNFISSSWSQLYNFAADTGYLYIQSDVTSSAGNPVVTYNQYNASTGALLSSGNSFPTMPLAGGGAVNTFVVDSMNSYAFYGTILGNDARFLYNAKRLFIPMSLLTLPEPNKAISKANLDYIRTQVNTFRTNNGLSAYTWTDPVIVAQTSTVAGTPVKAIHMNEIETAINQVYTTSGQSYLSQASQSAMNETVLANSKSYQPHLDMINRIQKMVNALQNQ